MNFFRSKDYLLRLRSKIFVPGAELPEQITADAPLPPSIVIDGTTYRKCTALHLLSKTYKDTRDDGLLIHVTSGADKKLEKLVEITPQPQQHPMQCEDWLRCIKRADSFNHARK